MYLGMCTRTSKASARATSDGGGEDAGCIHQAHLERVFLHFRAFDHSVYNCNVLGVVFCVMQRHSLPRDVWLKSIVGER